PPPPPPLGRPPRRRPGPRTGALEQPRARLGQLLPPRPDALRRPDPPRPRDSGRAALLTLRARTHRNDRAGHAGFTRVPRLFLCALVRAAPLVRRGHTILRRWVAPRRGRCADRSLWRA